MKMIFQTFMIVFYVNLPGCTLHETNVALFFARENMEG